VEDHPLIRHAVVRLLEGELGAIEATFAKTGREGLAAGGPWDLILLDHQLPDAKGVDLLPEYVRSGPVVVLTSYGNGHLAALARRRGAKGFVSKGDDPAQILSVIRDVLGGAESFPILETAPPPALSPQESRILSGLLEDRTFVEIAKDLSVTPTTIQSYKERLFAKFEVGSVTELVRKVVAKGLG
jgi:DNA-binding NarL/FixJ family response regulator